MTGIVHRTSIRVRYQETDQMGVAYHGNYFTWFEVGRGDAFRSAGLPYTVLEKQGVYLPVAHAECSYKNSFRYDDVVTIETTVEKLTAARIQFQYQVLGEDGRVFAHGSTVHGFVDGSGKAVNMAKKAPDIFKTIQENI